MLKNNPAFLVPGFIFSLVVVLALSGCGGGVSTTQGNPSGFSNSSLNGTYVFAITGANGGGFFTFAGTFTANGSGSITGGTADINSPGTGVVLNNVAINGSYAVHADGRTVATINTTSLNPNITFGLDLVILNSQSALVIRFDNNATASGTVDLQNASAANLSSLAGTFAFNIAGVDSASTQGPESSAGLLTFDASGNISSGVLDDNDAGSVNGGAGSATPVSISAAAGAISAPSNGRGTATITTSGSLALTLHFAYYVIDANHLKLIETDAAPILAGDAFRQSSTPVSGNFVFTLAGATATGHGVFVAGGVLNTDGAGNILNSSVEDFDNGGVVSAAGGATVTGTYAVSGGRGTMQINSSGLTLNLVFYPSTGGLQMLDVDAGAIAASGAALTQAGGGFSNSSINGGFGLNFTGVTGAGGINGASEFDSVAQFNATGSGTLSGAIDVNNFGSLSNGLSLNGNYTVNSNGRGTAALRTSQGNLNLVFYMASNARVLFVELDENVGQISVGSFAAQ